MDINTILNDFLASDDLNKLTRDIGTFLGCPIMVLDNTFKVLSHYSPEEFNDCVFDGSLKRGEVTYEVISMFNWNPNIIHAGGIYMGIQDSPYKRRFSALITSGTRVGYLICVDIKANLHNIDENSFQYIENILAKQLFSDLNKSSLHFSTAEDILIHLLDGKFTDKSLFDVQISSTFLSSYSPKRFALINLSLYRSLNFFENSLKNELNYLFYASHPFIYRDDVILFLSENHSMDSLKSISERFQLRIVVSDELKDIYLMPKEYKKARNAMDYLLTKCNGHFVVKSEDLNELMLLKSLEGQDNMISSKMIALYDHDKQSNTQYCLTLYTYLACHHSLKDTCERLFTHKNTVLYRIRKIKEDFISDIENPEMTLYYLICCALLLLADGKDNLFLQGLELSFN